MLNLTNASDGQKLSLNISHIVAVREDRGQVFILTSVGVEYAVKSTFDEIGKDPVWNGIGR